MSLEVRVMRKSLLIIILFCLAAAGCGGERTVNGTNLKTANKSLIFMKRELPSDKRLEFEIAFWTLKDSYPKNSEFLDIVDDQTSDEIIELGKQHFNDRRAKGEKAYTKYASWEDMLVAVGNEREANALPNEPVSERDKKNNVLYELRNL